MALYKYKAKNKEGAVYERTHEAKDRLDIYAVIREEGGTVISIKEIKAPISLSVLNNLFSGIKTHEKIILAKNLGLMIKAGLPVTRALSVMRKQAKRKPLEKLLDDLEESVSHGKTLSESLANHPKVFSPLFISMVKAGEESGSVPGALAIVSAQMEKSYLLVKKVRGAMIYPAVIISVMIILSILLLIFMVPTLTATFEGIGAKLPLSTRILIALSRFMVEHTIAVLGLLVASIASAILFLKSKTGRNLTDVVLVHLPIIGTMVKEFESARTARTLSSLLAAGVDIVVAMDATIDVLQNHLYKDVLHQARNAVEKGEPISAIFIEAEKIYPLFVGEMVAVGEETGKITDMLLSVANYYEEEVDQRTKDLSTIIEPLLMIIIGAGVGIFAVSMIAPTYSLVNYIQ